MYTHLSLYLYFYLRKYFLSYPILILVLCIECLYVTTYAHTYKVLLSTSSSMIDYKIQLHETFFRKAHKLSCASENCTYVSHYMKFVDIKIQT